MSSQTERGRLFADLHRREGAFLIPNPWDVGSARLLERLGFEALATSSAGYAFSRGRRDGTIARGEMLEHVREVAAATALPVSGDLENGYGDDPETVAETVRLAAAAGLVGCSIEDSTKDPEAPLYEPARAAERVRAAAEAARALPFPFVLTARAENFLVGRGDLADAVRRLQAYQEAGADVLYAPGLAREEDVAAVVAAVDRPVNVLMTPAMSLAALARLGVRRVSVGGALCRVALGAFLRAAEELRDRGTFGAAGDAVGFAELSGMFEG